jgi:hypothetical protein
MIPLGVSIQYDGLLSYYDHGSAPSYHDPREMVPLTGSAKIWTHLSWSDLRALTGPLGLRLDLRFPADSASFRLEGKAHVTAQRLGLARALRSKCNRLRERRHAKGQERRYQVGTGLQVPRT